jgi:hypothetical protein
MAQERRVALTGLDDLSAGGDADARGIQEQTGHHGGIEGRSAAGLVLVGGMDLGETGRGEDIDQEEYQVIVRELGGRRVGLLGIEFGCPGTIGFAARVFMTGLRCGWGRSVVFQSSVLNADFRGGKSTDISRVSGRRCRDHR